MVILTERKGGSGGSWNRLASVTLSSAGDTLDSGTFTAHDLLRFYYLIIPDTQITSEIRLNSDGAGNYGERYVQNGTNVVNSGATGWNGDPGAPTSPVDGWGYIFNQETRIKQSWFNSTVKGSGSSAPETVYGNGKWNNTVDNVTSLQIVNTLGGNDLDVGSILVVEGMNY